MKPSVRHNDCDAPGAERHWPENCWIIELSNTPDDPDASIARVRVAPRSTTRWHRLVGTAERYAILEGTGRVEVGGLAPQGVGVGDVVLIPPSCPQRITNQSTMSSWLTMFIGVQMGVPIMSHPPPTT